MRKNTLSMLISYYVTIKCILLLASFCSLSFEATTLGPRPRVKAEEYLVQFGYVNVSDAGNGTGFGRSMILDTKEVSEGIKLFQRRNGLNVTGIFDEATKKKFQQPRCGVKDIHARNIFGKWRENNLKYKLIGPVTPYLSRSKVRDAIKAAFDYWAQVTPLTFMEVFDEEKAHFNLKFSRYRHDDEFPFDGRDGTLAHAFFPTDGRIHFDSDELFTEDEDRGYNLRIVAAHEIGHAIGLPHSYDPTALMAAFYAGYTSKDTPLLYEDDIRNIQRIYGRKPATTASSSSSRATKTRRMTRIATAIATDEPTTTPESTTQTTQSTVTSEPTTTIDSTTTDSTTTASTTTDQEIPESTTEEEIITIKESTEEPFIPTQEPSYITDSQWEKVTPGDLQPDVCSSSTNLSAVFMGKDSKIHIVIKHKDIQWIYNNDIATSVIAAGWPHRSDDFFKRTSVLINAAVFINLSKQYYLFSGSRVFIFDEYGYFNRDVDTGKEVIYAFNLLEMKTLVVTKDNMAWEFNPITLEFKSPQAISSIFPGIPADIDGAAEDYPWAESITYIFFFKGREYYKYDADRKEQVSKGNFGDSFFGCRQYPVPKLK